MCLVNYMENHEYKFHDVDDVEKTGHQRMQQSELTGTNSDAISFAKQRTSNDRSAKPDPKVSIPF